jgi:dienelactone hydrolase
MEKSEYPAMVGDALLALEYLETREGVDPGRIGIIGASIGANVAINAAAKDESVKTVGLLSPGIEYHLIKTEPAMREFKGAVFLAVSDEDRYAAESVRKLDELCAGKCEMKMYSGAGHGTNMFAPTEGDLQMKIVAWLDATLMQGEEKSTDETE